MSTAPGGWQAPKTNWTPEDNVGVSDLSRWEGNEAAIETGDRTLDQAQTPTSHVGTLRQILDWVVNRIKAITGAEHWYSAPATTLAAAKTHADATITSSTAAHGIQQGDGNGLDADKLDGKHWVEVVSTTKAVAKSGGLGMVAIASGGGHRKFLASVYGSGGVTVVNGYIPGQVPYWYISLADNTAVLTISNPSAADITCYVSIFEWK